jgi:hypothetical protein
MNYGIFCITANILAAHFWTFAQVNPGGNHENQTVRLQSEILKHFEAN